MTASALFVGVATSGVGIAATRYTARYSHTSPARLGAVLALSSGIAILTATAAAAFLLLFSGQLARYAYNLPLLAPTLRISAIYLFFVVLNGYQVGTAVGLGAFQAMTFVHASQCLVSWATVGILTAIGGVSGATLGMGVAAGLMWLQYKITLSRLLEQRGVTLNYRECSREMGIFWSFAMPAAVAGLLGATGAWIATALLVKSHGGLKEIALFNAAIVFRSCVLFAPAIMQKVISISLSEMWGRVDQVTYRSRYYRNVAYNLAAAIGIAFPLLFLKRVLLGLFGREFTDLHNVAVYILLFAVVEVGANSLYQAIPAVGAMWWQVRVLILWSVSLVGGAILLVPSFGARGLALSYLVAWIVSTAAYYTVSRALLSSPEYHVTGENR